MKELVWINDSVPIQCSCKEWARSPEELAWNDFQEILNEKKQTAKEHIWYAMFCVRKKGKTRKYVLPSQKETYER